MELFVVVIALAFIQVWGARNPLHRDTWFKRWIKFVSKDRPIGFQDSWLGLFCVIGIPAVFLWWFIVFLVGHSVWILLPISVVILLYSFGRGEFREIVRSYTQACYVEDWSIALERARGFGVETQNLGEDEWSSLNQRVFEQAAYRGFERMFGVLFWFFLLGPVAAFAYRLLVLFVDGEKLADDLESAGIEAEGEAEAEGETGVETETSDVNKEDSDEWLSVSSESRTSIILRYVEWPATRLLALTFSLTGNFSTTIESWGKNFMSADSPSRAVLNDACLGALSLSDESESSESKSAVTRKELNLLTKLYTRTLWLWLALAAFFFLYA